MYLVLRRDIGIKYSDEILIMDKAMLKEENPGEPGRKENPITILG